MATITATRLASAGIDFTADGTAAAGGGDQVKSRKDLILAFQNLDASSTTVTIVTQGTADGNDVDDVEIAVAADDTAMAVISGSLYQDANGFIQITYSSATSLSVIATYI